jgi:hypothetical protein
MTQKHPFDGITALRILWIGFTEMLNGTVEPNLSPFPLK